MSTHCIAFAQTSALSIKLSKYHHFPTTRISPKGEKEKKKEVKEFICMYKNPAQVSRERTALTQYDREGFEIPRFQ